MTITPIQMLQEDTETHHTLFYKLPNGKRVNVMKIEKSVWGEVSDITGMDFCAPRRTDAPIGTWPIIVDHHPV